MSLKRFTVATIAPFSASEQIHCALVVCDCGSDWVTISLYTARFRYPWKWLQHYSENILFCTKNCGLDACFCFVLFFFLSWSFCWTIMSTALVSHAPASIGQFGNICIEIMISSVAYPWVRVTIICISLTAACIAEFANFSLLCIHGFRCFAPKRFQCVCVCVCVCAVSYTHLTLPTRSTV